MDKIKLRKSMYVIIAMAIPVLVFMLYSLHVITLLRYAPITSQCSSTNANDIRISLYAFEYGFAPSHSNNLSNYMNHTCLVIQSDINNLTWKEIK